LATLEDRKSHHNRTLNIRLAQALDETYLLVAGETVVVESNLTGTPKAGAVNSKTETRSSIRGRIYLQFRRKN
jgi:hypothetical protein